MIGKHLHQLIPVTWFGSIRNCNMKLWNHNLIGRSSSSFSDSLRFICFQNLITIRKKCSGNRAGPIWVHLLCLSTPNFLLVHFSYLLPFFFTQNITKLQSTYYCRLSHLQYPNYTYLLYSSLQASLIDETSWGGERGARSSGGGEARI